MSRTTELFYLAEERMSAPWTEEDRVEFRAACERIVKLRGQPVIRGLIKYEDEKMEITWDETHDFFEIVRKPNQWAANPSLWSSNPVVMVVISEDRCIRHHGEWVEIWEHARNLDAELSAPGPAEG